MSVLSILVQAIVFIVPVYRVSVQLSSRALSNSTRGITSAVILLTLTLVQKESRSITITEMCSFNTAHHEHNEQCGIRLG